LHRVVLNSYCHRPRRLRPTTIIIITTTTTINIKKNFVVFRIVNYSFILIYSQKEKRKNMNNKFIRSIFTKRYVFLLLFESIRRKRKKKKEKKLSIGLKCMVNYCLDQFR